MSDTPAIAMGHQFLNPTLLQRALTHTSYAHEQDTRHNERLEFLGDAILQACMTTLLFERFPDADEGRLSRFRSRMVSTEALASLAVSQGLDGVLRLGRGERRSGGHQKLRILAGTFEAVLGALYLDVGFSPCLDTLKRIAADHLDALDDVADAEGEEAWQDPRSRLQEITQRSWRTTPTYHVTASEGPDHEPTFTVEVRLDERTLGEGRGRTKREAGRLAAVEALRNLNEDSS